MLIVRYYLLVSSSEWNAESDVRSLCDTILKKTLKEQDKYQIGLTKIFFRAGMLAVLEGLRTARLNQLVTVVQKNVRRWIDLRRFRDLKAKTINIQCWWRVVLAKRLAEDMRRERAALRIQTVARGWLARKEYARTRAAVIKIQSGTSTTSNKVQYADIQLSVVIKLGNELSRNGHYRPPLHYRACSEV